MKRWQVVLFASLTAVVAWTPALFWPAWTVLVAEVLAAGVSSWATYTKTVVIPGPRSEPKPETVQIPKAPRPTTQSLYTRVFDLAHALDQSSVGVCFVDHNGGIVHIAGGAMREVGTKPEQLVGTELTPPYVELGFLPALRGERAIFVTPDPVRGELDQVIRYQPWTTRSGRIQGAVIWWMNIPKGFMGEAGNGSDER